MLYERINYLKKEWANEEISLSAMRRILSRYKKPQRWICTLEERKFYDNLPDIVTLFRGGSISEINSTFSISWTTSRPVACFFAFRNGIENRAVFSTTIPKTEIRAVLVEREEDECLILNPKNVEIVTTQPTEHFAKYQKFRAEYDRKEKAMYNEIVKIFQGMKF